MLQGERIRPFPVWPPLAENERSLIWQRGKLGSENLSPFFLSHFRGALHYSDPNSLYSSSAFFCCRWISRSRIGLCEIGTAGGEDSSRSSAIAAYLLAKARYRPAASGSFDSVANWWQRPASLRKYSALRMNGSSALSIGGQTAESSNRFQSRDLPRPWAYPSNARLLLSANRQDGITTTGWFLSPPEMP